MSITNYDLIKSEIGNVDLVAVTKYNSREDILAIIKEGATRIGESRVIDSKDKLEGIKGVTKHLIGHLQSNKVRLAVEIFDVIETIDSVKIAKKISDFALDIGKTIEVFIQVNIGREDQKYGLMAEDLDILYDSIKDLEGVNVTGLMCIVPNIDKESRRKHFREMKQLQLKLGLTKLSMGMSSDYRIAIEEGATQVRIGSALFK